MNGHKPTGTNKLQGHWTDNLQLRHLHYGQHCVQNHLPSLLPVEASSVFLITGKSIATKTPLVSQIENILGSRHAATFSDVRQHGPAADVERALDLLSQSPSASTIISLGGGSPIDTAKTLSYRTHERTGRFLTHLTIPTTLSAAECTAGGGYTKEDGVKIGFMDPGMGVTAILYDPEYAQYTPRTLWLSTGMRALDHAVESYYHPTSSEVPWKALSFWAVTQLFEFLPKAAAAHPEVDPDITVSLFLAAFASSGMKGKHIKGGMGLSHSLGHALGSPYGISHGLTSCLTLAKVVELKARQSEADANQIARLLPATGAAKSGDNRIDAIKFSRQIQSLTHALGVEVGTLESWNVPFDDVSLIVQRATGGMEAGPYVDAVTALVVSLYGRGT